MAFNRAELESHDDRPVGDQCVHLRGTYDDYEAILRVRGEYAVPRISYLDGHIIIVTPSREHEGLKSLIGRLIETYCMWRGKEFTTAGSWTLNDRSGESGAEPDESYIFDGADVSRPHLAIEVVWTSVGIDKLEIYRRLNVQEVWVWRHGHVAVHSLTGEGYELLSASRFLPELDLDELLRFVDRPTTSRAMVDYRAHLDARAEEPSR